MKYSLIISIFPFCLGLSQTAQANMFNIPSALVCVQYGTENVVADVFKLGDGFLVEFRSKNGELAHLPVYHSDRGFSSKSGQWYNVSLLNTGSSNYLFSVYAVNSDGSNGKADVDPIEVICTTP